METIHEKKNKFYIGANEEEPVGQLSFHIEKNKLIIDHVYIAKALRNKGLGAKLVEKAVVYARENQLILVPYCSYAESVLLENRNYWDVYKGD